MFDRTGYIMRQAMKERVIVTLKTGEGFEGVLFWADGKTWEITEAKALGVGQRGEDAPVNGRLLIPAHNVAYCQKP